MTTYETYSLALNGLIALAAFGTLFIYSRQLGSMSKEIKALESTSKAQRSLQMISFLQSEEVRVARHHVRSKLKVKPVLEWTSEDKKEAGCVVANYDVAGALLKEDPDLIPLVVNNWGPSINHCYLLTQPYIEKLRSESGGNANYWSNFEWLYEQTKG